MYDADSTQDRELTTEQIANAGTAPTQPEVPGQTGRQGYQDDYGYQDDDNAAAPVADRAADPGQRASLLDEGELQSLMARWKDIQAEFVEEPKGSVQQADALVAELMQRLATMFAAERAELENRWAGGNEVSTEDLRQGLRLYHSFFQRLLAA
jgi:hypothetical protein